MIKSSAHEGRDWKPSKTDEQYNAEMVRDSLEPSKRWRGRPVSRSANCGP
ncbi:hypothetical protein ACIOJD_26130 [Streptomyces sp. NPDC088116]